MDFWIIQRIIVVLIDIVSIWLGFLVYSHHSREKIGRAFALMVLIMLIWVNFAYAARLMGENQVLSEIFLKIAWFATPILLASFYFLIIFLLETNNYRWLNKLVIISSGVVGGLTGFTSSVVGGVKFVNESLTIAYGEMMYLYLGVAIFLILANLYVLFSGYKKLSLQKKRQVEYFLIGMSVFCLCNATFNVILPMYKGITRFYYLGDYSTIFLLIFTAYAIVRRNLFETKTVLTTILIALISILLTVEFFVFSGTMGMKIFKGIILVAFFILAALLFKAMNNEAKQKEELAHLALGLERANRDLKKLDQAKSEFLSIASHQLRTPLTAMRGYLSMLIKGDFGPLSEKTRKVVLEVYQASLRLLKLSNDLLNVSRIESGKSVLNYQQVSIGDLISSVVEEMKVEINNKNLSLELKIEEDLPLMEIDAGKIRQVLLNLVDNAIKYTEKGGLTIEAVELDNGKIMVKVSDTGIGLDKKDIAKLFQSFSRGRAGNSLHASGAGLGLYVARKFIDQHGGRIWVNSPGKGKGSTFFIELPIKPRENKA